MKIVENKMPDCWMDAAENPVENSFDYVIQALLHL